MSKLPMRKSTIVQALLLLQLLTFHVFSQPDGSTAPMEKTEQEALYLAIQSLVGKWWNGSELYPDPCGWTPIQGVSCDFFDGLWYVAALDIGPVLENSLECTQDAKFSQLLFKLKHLKSLSFFNCFSSHRPTTIPSSNWEKLAGSLETLAFRSNRGLIGEIPASLGQLTNLRSLVLVENSLTGMLPRELGNLVNLQRLVLTGNGFNGQIPVSLANNLSELLILDISRNTLSGSLPSSFGSLTSLLTLDLSNNILGGSLPSELGELRNLTLLDLRNNNLSGGLTHSLQGMTSIQDMLLSNNPLGGSLMEFGWESLRNLTTLDLSNTSITGVIPDSISSLKTLRFLALDNNHLSGGVSPKLAALPSLRALYLSGNNFTGELEFSQGFYERMRGRFASWNNPNLCYGSEVTSTGHVPFGVERCKHEQENSAYNSGTQNKVNGGSSNQDSNLLASFGFSTSMNGLWWAIAARELVLVLLLILLQ
ncbi:piriformospora indica-insensitive protein 2-like [Phoenix dactylifera]|uniref:Piriformospora indica-insensitive protein 2-like n=1 Tax=Phoenix dactylifera TaxID=42345 RepID=A0A8B7BNZ1_PHODC|nr:piriformospora indica-insensitive protein 2-like [Phoenix dactylifera]